MSFISISLVTTHCLEKVAVNQRKCSLIRFISVIIQFFVVVSRTKSHIFPDRQLDKQPELSKNLNHKLQKKTMVHFICSIPNSKPFHRSNKREKNPKTVYCLKHSFNDYRSSKSNNNNNIKKNPLE